ncbi:hypothetical protein BKA69DRAFT_1165483 [Paraphysoderma sedebokerense]|nr:hypothetical protein BKA69DRAFT_1165483 [Paraphysoderma sedebokerense]
MLAGMDIESAIDQVIAITHCSHSRYKIAQDLKTTNSVDATVTRIFNGKVSVDFISTSLRFYTNIPKFDIATNKSSFHNPQFCQHADVNFSKNNAQSNHSLGANKNDSFIRNFPTQSMSTTRKPMVCEPIVIDDSDDDISIPPNPSAIYSTSSATRDDQLLAQRPISSSILHIDLTDTPDFNCPSLNRSKPISSSQSSLQFDDHSQSTNCSRSSSFSLSAERSSYTELRRNVSTEPARPSQTNSSISSTVTNKPASANPVIIIDSDDSPIPSRPTYSRSSPNREAAAANQSETSTRGIGSKPAFVDLALNNYTESSSDEDDDDLYELPSLEEMLYGQPPASSMSSSSRQKSRLQDCVPDIGRPNIALSEEPKAKKRKKQPEDAAAEKARKEEEKREKAKLREEAKRQKEREKELKKLEREVEKQRKKEEKEAEKASKQALKDANRLKDKIEYTKELTVQIDSNLASTQLGSQFILLCHSIPTTPMVTSLPIPYTINFRRTSSTYYDKSKQTWIPCVDYQTTEPFTVKVFLASDFLQLVAPNIRALFDHTADLKAQYPKTRILFIIQGLEEYYRRQLVQMNRGFKANILGSTSIGPKRKNAGANQRDDEIVGAPPISKNLVEDALAVLQVRESVLIVLTKNQEETIDNLCSIIKELAMLPYKIIPDTSSSSFCPDITVRSGTTPTDTYLKMLTEINLLTVPVAKAIITQYPTLKSLYDAYMRVGRSAGEKLLADIEIVRNGTGTTRRIGPAISTRVYNIFMGTDPNANAVGI